MLSSSKGLFLFKTSLLLLKSCCCQMAQNQQIHLWPPIITVFSISSCRWLGLAMKIPNVQSCLGPNIYPEVPDGGWGWVVALAFFLVEVCTYGVIKSLGVFLQDLMEEFGESNSRVSWVISICVFVFAFSGQSLLLHSFKFLRDFVHADKLNVRQSQEVVSGPIS